MEADMSRFHQLDLRDLWRRDEQGRPRLTYRMVYVRVKALPATSALAINANGGKRPWTVSEYLLADLWELQANRGIKRGARPKRHPARPAQKAKARTPEQQRRHDQAMRRHRRKYQQHYRHQS
ncbi:hypothetical protein A9310_19785 [Gordonia sp. UCD-TK1]|nr:hypothetical protein A9310_19785 [Gordonia sp. UCD-TK1]